MRWLVAAGFLAIVLALPAALYLWLTRAQRRGMREIRQAAAAQGWTFRIARWQGNPTAFRIDGRTRAGEPWILTSGNTSGYDRGWSVQMRLRFPSLGGESDFAVAPRADGAHQFVPDGREMPSGMAAFDAAYHVSAAGRISRPPIDSALAARLLAWPAGAIAPHSLLAWRDRFALRVEFRLPAPPNWAAVAYAVSAAEDLVARLPPPVSVPRPHGVAARIMELFLR